MKSASCFVISVKNSFGEIGDTTIDLTTYVTQTQFSQLEAKVDDISTGKYYGYYATAADLPDDATADGFAYVGSGPTYTIYNCEGGAWTSSGITVNQSPIGNDEDIDQNADGKLQFANRVYNSLQPNGMGYKILRENATFAAQVTDTNTIYEIRYDFDLSGTDVSIPANSVLRFEGGRLLNAKDIVLGSSVKIEGGEIRSIGSIYFNYGCCIDGCKLRRTTALGNDESFVIMDDNYFDRIDSNIRISVLNTEFKYFEGDTANTKGNMIEIASHGNYLYSGFYNVTFENVILNGYVNKSFYIHAETTTEGGTTKNGWITDIAFIRCNFERMKTAWYIHSTSNTAIHKVNIIGCAVQANTNSSYALELGKAALVNVIATEFFDWNSAASGLPINVTTETGNVYIDYITGEKGYKTGGNSLEHNNNIYIDRWNSASKRLELYLDLTQSDVKKADFAKLPDGVYILPEDATVGNKLGIFTWRGGTLFVTSHGNIKFYCYISNSADSNTYRRTVSFMSIIGSVSSTEVLAASSWFSAMPMRFETYRFNHIWGDSQDQYIKCRTWKTANGASLPSTTAYDIGEIFLSDQYSIPAVCIAANKWDYMLTRPAIMCGASTDRPTLGNSTKYKGMYYYDTTLNKPIWWTGTAWVDATGTTVV